MRRHRAIVRAGNRDELVAGLQAVADGSEHPLVARSGGHGGARTAFVFPGQGSQWAGMGAQTYRELPVYRAEADRLTAAIVGAGLPTPLPFLTACGAGPVSHEELHAAQFVHSVALAAVWRSCGILPDLTLGHSLGEVAAAYVAETVTLDDAVSVLAARAAAIAAIPGENGVAVLGVDPGEAADLIAGCAGWLELSAVNSQASVAVSGERRAVAAIVAAARARGRFARELAMSFPAHTTAMETQREHLNRRLPRSVFAESPIQFVGSATGRPVEPGTDFGEYWYANLRNTIRFDRAVQTAIGLGAGMYAEMSAHPALLFAIEDAAEGSGVAPVVVVGSGHRDQPVRDRLSANISALAAAEPAYRWRDLLSTDPPPLHGFPPAPMRAEHLWAVPEPLPAATGLTVATESWRPCSPHPPSGGPPRQVAVVPMGGNVHNAATVSAGTAAPLVAALRAAVAGRPDTAPADPREADLVIAVAPGLHGRDAAGSVERLSAAVDAGVLGYPEVFGPRCRDVWLVTTGAESVTDDDPVADLAQAGLAAMHRSIGFEHPDQSFHHLDLPVGTASAPAAVELMIGGAGEVAIRGNGVGYQRVLDEEVSNDEVSLVSPSQLDSDALANVVIAGGSGAIGLSYARFLADHGARRILLLSRRGVAPELLERIGTRIDAPACDLRDAAQLADTAARYAGEPASLIIHAAGTATFANRAQITGSALADMAGAKVVGLEALTRAWPMRADARILLCSSVTGVWGGKGVGGYAAANRMLDVMAARLRAEGRHCTAIRFGLWQGSGIVDAAEITRVERSGLRPMQPELAVQTSLGERRRDPLVLAGDPERLRRFFGAGTARSAPETEAGRQPLAAPEAVRTQLAAVLGVDTASLDLDASLFDLGVDSLLALDLRKRLKRVTGQTVPMATLLGGITGTDLIAGLSEKVDSSSD